MRVTATARRAVRRRRGNETHATKTHAHIITTAMSVPGTDVANETRTSPGTVMSYAFVRPNAGRAGMSDPSTSTLHRVVYGTERWSVPGSDCTDDPRVEPRDGRTGVAPVRSFAIIDSAPADFDASAPDVVSNDATGTQAAFSKIARSGDE